MNIDWLMPEQIEIKVWDNIYTVYCEDWKYILNIQLIDKLETDNVYVYVNNKLFDTIDRRIALRAGDTLHLEYSLDVW